MGGRLWPFLRLNIIRKGAPILTRPRDAETWILLAERAPWLSLRTQAAIHATIPILLTAVKFVTVPLFLLLTPLASRHPTFRSWTGWSKAKFRQLERILQVPLSLAKALFLRAKSMFLRREGVKSGSPADEAEGKGDKSSAN